MQAQSTICPAINAFEGEWRYVNGQDTIKIYLRPADYTVLGLGTPETISKLWGWHEYKRGNTIIESNYANRFMPLPTNSDAYTATFNSITLSMPLNCETSGNRLIGRISDLSQCYEAKVVTITYNASKTQLTWNQRHATGYGFITGCKGMTLPANFVLIKQ